jgi:hypothetical protein
MDRSYAIEPVGPRTTDKAYSLAQIIAPELSQPEWRQLCQSCETSNAPSDEVQREQILVALNAEAYVKGLCIYAVRKHATYGRVLDVPVFITASAADGEGVAAALINFLKAKGDQSVCSGIRFWRTTRETWRHRLKVENIARSDHGLFMPASAIESGIEKALCAHAIEGPEAIDRFSL